MKQEFVMLERLGVKQINNTISITANLFFLHLGLSSFTISFVAEAKCHLCLYYFENTNISFCLVKIPDLCVCTRARSMQRLSHS